MVLTPAHYCVLSSLPWPCKHHSSLILSCLSYQACQAEGKFRVCDQISPIPDGKLLLNYIRNVSFTSRFRGLYEYNPPQHLTLLSSVSEDCITASRHVAAWCLMCLTLSYQIYIWASQPSLPSWITYSWKFRELLFSVLHQVEFELNMSYKWCL